MCALHRMRKFLFSFPTLFLLHPANEMLIAWLLSSSLITLVSSLNKFPVPPFLFFVFSPSLNAKGDYISFSLHDFEYHTEGSFNPRVCRNLESVRLAFFSPLSSGWWSGERETETGLFVSLQSAGVFLLISVNLPDLSYVFLSIMYMRMTPILLHQKPNLELLLCRVRCFSFCLRGTLLTMPYSSSIIEVYRWINQGQFIIHTHSVLHSC